MSGLKQCPICEWNMGTRFGKPIVQDPITGNWWPHTCKGTGGVIMKIDEVFKFPLKYDYYGQSILDQDNNKVLDIRGWGHILHLSIKAGEIQDNIGKFVCDTINEKVKNLEV